MGSTVDLSVETIIGAYLRIGKQASQTLYPYLILGLSEVELEAKSSSTRVSDSESDVSIGAGIDLSASNTTRFSLEYIRYYDKSHVEISGFNFGLSHAF